MPLSIEQMRANLRGATGENELQLGDDAADLYLNKSFWQLMADFPFKEKELTLTFETVVGTRNYALPVAFEAINLISIIDPDSNEHEPLTPISIHQYETEHDSDEERQGIPTRYTHEANFIRLQPTPDKVYTLVLKHKTTLADLIAGKAVPIPQDWHEIIEYGAKWRRFGDLRNYADMFANKKMQEALIESKIPTHAKEKANQPQAGLQVLGRKY